MSEQVQQSAVNMGISTSSPNPNRVNSPFRFFVQEQSTREWVISPAHNDNLLLEQPNDVVRKRQCNFQRGGVRCSSIGSSLPRSNSENV